MRDFGTIEVLSGSPTSGEVGNLPFADSPRFEVTAKLGAGGMGVVYKAFDRELRAHCALKVLNVEQPEALLRFKNEFRGLADVRHPNLVRLGELGEWHGSWYFTMELVEGVDVLEYIRPRQADLDGRLFDELRLRASLGQLVRALDAVHETGKVHRDVKPRNIRVTGDGRLVLLDFGLVLDIGNADRSEGWMLGTAAYMAPEQAYAGGACAASDLYAVGGVLYQALTGELPFHGSDLDVLMQKQQVIPPRPKSLVAGVPDDLDALCMDLLAIAPADRPASAEVLARLASEGAAALVAQRRPLDRSVLFFGRRAELDRLLVSLQEPPRSRTFVVQGQSGIGKSALLAQFVAAARRTSGDTLMLRGRCYEKESVPYKGIDRVVDALTNHLRNLPAGRVARLLPRNAGLLARAFPVLRRIDGVVSGPRHRMTGDDAIAVQRRTFAALRELFQRLAWSSAVVVIIEDMQWADADTMTVLADLMREPEAPPITYVLSRRAPAEGRGDPLLERLAGADVVELGPLPVSETEALASALLASHGLPNSGQQASTLAREAAGHPMFLQELVRHVASAGMDKRHLITLDDAFVARFDRLTPPARRLLDVVAVAGSPLRHEVVARAAGLDSAQYPQWINELRAANLVSTDGERRSDSIEPYHNRVREAALNVLSELDRTAIHASLADALETTGAAELAPEVVVHHLTSAGHNARAAYHAEVAAHRARDSFAFERAAAHYRLARELGSYDPADNHRLRVDEASCLCDAGRAAEAAEIYLELSRESRANIRFDYLRRAAEQLLACGRVERGLSVAAEVLTEIGEVLPKTRVRAIVRLLWQRICLRIRGLRWQRTEEGEHRPLDLARLDLYNAIAAGLALVDGLSAGVFQAQATRLALALGEPRRLVRSLALESLFAASVVDVRRVAAIRNVLQPIADELDDPASRSYALLPAAYVRFFVENRWRGALEKLEAAEELMSRQPRAGGCEAAAVQVFSCSCLLYLGDLVELGQRVKRYERSAERRGDLAAAANLSARLVVLAMARDQPREGDLEIHAALHKWPANSDALQLQELFAAQSRCELAMYCGQLVQAEQIVQQIRGPLHRSRLLRVPLIAAEIGYLHGRVALARAAQGGPGQERRAQLRRATHLGRRLRRARSPLARGLGSLLIAGAAGISGRRKAAVTALRRAISELDELEARLYAEPARMHLGRLVGGDEGQSLRQAGLGWLRGQAVVAPEQLATVLVPDCGPT
jgi:eukaryotic-like serine/threonine-protein kinase